MFLAASLASCVARPAVAVGMQPGVRPIALDWASAETLFALGVRPVAITDRDRFVAANPDLVEHPVLDLGPPWEPNLELIDALSPSVIYTSNYTRLVEPKLRQIAPVIVSDLHGGRIDQIARCAAFARRIVEDPRTFAESAKLVALEAVLTDTEMRLASDEAPSVLCIFPHGNGRFVNVFGPNSFAGNVMRYVGLKNAWTAPTNANGFDYVGIERLAVIEGAHLVVLGDGRGVDRALKALDASPLWHSNDAVRRGAITVFPNVAMYGALPTAARFSRQLVETLGTGSAHAN